MDTLWGVGSKAGAPPPAGPGGRRGRQERVGGDETLARELAVGVYGCSRDGVWLELLAEPGSRELPWELREDARRAAPSAPPPPAQVGAPLAGDPQVPGRHQLLLRAQGAILPQPKPRALHRDAAFDRQRKHKQESSPRQDQSTAGPPSVPELCRGSHPWVPNLSPVPSRAASSWPRAQPGLTPSLVWLRAVHPLAALRDAVPGWIGAGMLELSLPGLPAECGWGELTLGASLCSPWPQAGSLPGTGTSSVGSSCSRHQPAPSPLLWKLW